MTVHTEETTHAGLEDQSGRCLVDFDQTGWELGDTYRVFISHAHAAFYRRALVRAYSSLGWDTAIALPALPVGSRDDLVAQAAALARETPQVASQALPAPRLSGNLAEDVHVVSGLTWDQLANVFGVTERAAAGWRAQGVPSHRVALMEALRAIGVTLVGGLGADGVAAWLMAGEPPRLERLRSGEVEAVAAEARSYLDVPAT